MLPKELPTIPAAEFRERWDRVRGMMEQQRLDLVLAYADDRAVFGAAHARWLSNFPVHFEPVCIVMTRLGEPHMLCGPESVEYARVAGQIADVRAASVFAHPNEDYPYTKIYDLAELLGGLSGGLKSARRVGLAGKGLMSADFLAAFQRALPSVEWVDVENAVCDLRAVKSPAEIGVIRYAYEIAEQGFQAAVNAISAGVTEREVAAEADAAMRRAGAEGTGIDTIVASGPNSIPILARSTFRQIQTDELVLLTIAPRYEGTMPLLVDPFWLATPALTSGAHWVWLAVRRRPAFTPSVLR